MQLRGEAFNVLNHPNPGYGTGSVGARSGYLPVTDIGNAGVQGNAFGENQDIQYARRVVQVGLRIVF